MTVSYEVFYRALNENTFQIIIDELFNSLVIIYTFNVFQ